MIPSIKVGSWNISLVDDHESPDRDVEVIFKQIPIDSWEPYREIAFNKEGVWKTQWRGHLIKRIDNEGPIILVDTGMGPGVHEHTGKTGQLFYNLKKQGVRATDITDVIITHGHGDHIGWCTDIAGNVLFPNAKYHVSKKDWDFYSDTNNKTNFPNPAFERAILPLRSHGVLELTEGTKYITPEVSIIPTNGHTPGHQCVSVQSGSLTAVITGDLFHNVAQVTEQTWCPIYDWDTKLSTKSRIDLMNKAHNLEWIICSGHLPTGTSIGKIIKLNKKFGWQSIA
mgnify:FL=1